MLKPQKKRISKEELKHDPLIDGLLNAQSFFENNQNSIIYSLLGVVAIVAIFMLGSYWYDSSQVEANTLLGKAQSEYDNLNLDKSRVFLEELIAEYSGNSAEQGTFLLANINFNENNFLEAQALYEDFVGSYSGSDLLLASGYAGIAACIETEDNAELAAQNYEKAARIADGLPQQAEYLYLAGINYIQSESNEKAISIFQSIVENHEDSPRKIDAEIKLILASAN